MFLALLLVSQGAKAQFSNNPVPDNQMAFGHDEKLSYNVQYSAAMFSTSVADVHFHTVLEKNYYKVTAVGKTRPFYSVFFDMEDQYQAWLDKSTLRPIRLTTRIKEGSYRYRSSFDYNWRSYTVRSFGQNLRSGNERKKTMTLTEGSYDALSLFFNMRCIDIEDKTFNTNYKLELLLKDTIRVINYRIIQREAIDIDGLGKFRTLKVACQIVTSDGSFMEGTEFLLWLTDDDNKIPVYMESPIRVGSIKVFLSSYENLRHPPDAHIVKTSK